MCQWEPGRDPGLATPCGAAAGGTGDDEKSVAIGFLAEMLAHSYGGECQQEHVSRSQLQDYSVASLCSYCSKCDVGLLGFPN